MTDAGRKISEGVARNRDARKQAEAKKRELNQLMVDTLQKALESDTLSASERIEAVKLLNDLIKR